MRERLGWFCLCGLVAACTGEEQGRDGPETGDDGETAAAEVAVEVEVESVPEVAVETEVEVEVETVPESETELEIESETELEIEVESETVAEVENETVAEIENETAAEIENETEIAEEVIIPPPGPAVMLIVAQDDLAAIGQTWAEYRTSRGFEVTLTSVTALAGDAPSADTFGTAVRAKLSELRAGRTAEPRMFLLLIGDAPAGGAAESGRIPAHSCENTTPGAGGCWTDNRYADLDGDDIPEVAVGRIPASNAADAATALTKIQGFESDYHVGEFNRRLALYVGQAGFGPEVDSLLEQAVNQGLTIVSHTFDIVGAWDNALSSYWYMPFNDKVVDLFNDGALMAVYIGHGSEEWTQGLSKKQVGEVHCDVRKPFAMFFACYAGNYANASPSLSETLAFKADGPIATLGSSDVSHPFGNAVLAYESQRVTLGMQHQTIGEVVVAIKHALFDDQGDDFRVLMAAGATLEDSCDTPEKQATILDQHLDLYNLLGDPGTSMQYPRGTVTFGAPTGSIREKHIVVSGTVTEVVDGTAIVTLETERDTIHGTLLPVTAGAPDAATVNTNWVTANNKAVVRLEVPVVGGAFTANLTWTESLVPSDVFYFKAYAYDATTDAIGHMKVPYVPAPPATP